MTRYYYICPIKAAYMSKEFGVNFKQWLYPSVHSTKVELCDVSFLDIVREIEYSEEDTKEGKFRNRYIVARISESIFEPKKADFILLPDIESFVVIDEVKKVFDNGNIETVSYQRPFEKGKQIIMRDNKHFFMPEVEND